MNDLPTLDPELYRSLLRLREHFTVASAAPATHDGSEHGAGAAAAAALDLGLTFVFADDAAAALGDPSEEVELKPRGRHIAVTAENVNEYIHRVAHYKWVAAGVRATGMRILCPPPSGLSLRNAGRNPPTTKRMPSCPCGRACGIVAAKACLCTASRLFPLDLLAHHRVRFIDLLLRLHVRLFSQFGYSYSPRSPRRASHLTARSALTRLQPLGRLRVDINILLGA
jgi:hypothetical protein